MNETQIKNALKAAGLDEGLYETLKLGAINFKDEKELEAEIARIKEDQANKSKSLKDEIKAKLKEAGYTDEQIQQFIGGEAQSLFDQKITKALKTAQENWKKQLEEQSNKNLEKVKEKEKEKERENMTEQERRIAELTDLVKNQGEQIKALTEKSTSSELFSQKTKAVKEAFKDDKLSDEQVGVLASFVNAEDPEKIAEGVGLLRNTIVNLQQANIDRQIKEGTLPVQGSKGGTIAESQAVSYAQRKLKQQEEQATIGEETQ